MIETQIQFDQDQLAEIRRLLAGIPNGMPRAMRSAINRTGQQVKTRTLRAITSQVNIKRSDIDGAKHSFGGVGLRRYGGLDAPGATVSVTGKRIPVYRFGARQNKRGVTYKIKRQGGRKQIKSGFIARMKSGHVGAFFRLTPKRLPIFEPFGPSIPQVAEDSPEMQRLMDVDAEALLRKNLESQVDRLLNRRRGTSG